MRFPLHTATRSNRPYRRPAHCRKALPTIACLPARKTEPTASLRMIRWAPAAALIAVLWLIAAPAARAAAPCSATAPAGGDWPAYGNDAANSRNQPAEHLLTPNV